MPRIEPLPREGIRDPELLKMMETCERTLEPDSLFFRLLARVPGYAEALCGGLHMSHTQGNVDPKLKEIIRVQLARTAGDTYFANLRSVPARRAGLTEEAIEAGAGDFEAGDRFTEAEKWALRYADKMYRDPKKVDAAFYAGLKKHYTEAQIMELGAFIALTYGMQVFMRTLRAFPTRDPEGNPVTQEASEKIYGSEAGR